MSSDMLYKATTLRKTALAFASAMASICAIATPFTYVDHWPSGSGDETATEVSVPLGVTAPIETADDVARVARLTSISFADSTSKVRYTSSTPLTLAARLSGAGTFAAESSGNLTIASDNAGLVSPGCFFLSNMCVSVTSSHGLGAAGTGVCNYHFGGKVDPLHFSGPGLTNEAPIRVYQGTASANFVLGPDSASDTLVISNNLIFTGGNGTKKIYFRNKIRFVGGTFGEKDYKHIYSDVTGGSAEVWFENEAKIVCYFWYAVGAVTFHVGWSGFDTWAYNFSLWQGSPSTLVAI